MLPHISALIAAYMRAAAGGRPGSWTGPFTVGLDAHSDDPMRNYAVPDHGACPGADDIDALITFFRHSHRVGDRRGSGGQGQGGGFRVRAVAADSAYGDQDGFRDGHTGTWYAADARLGAWGPDGLTRLVVATADPETLPGKATWYLATNLPRPGGPREAGSPHPAAGLAEVTRIYGIRHWIERSYRQVKDELGWADFQVRSDLAIRRHQALVNCAFCFCWDAWFADQPPQRGVAAPRPEPGRGERGAARRPAAAGTVLAPGAARGTSLAFPLDRAAALVAGVVQGAAAAASPDRLGCGRLRPAPLHP